AYAVKPQDSTACRDRAPGVWRDGLQVVHAKPTCERKRNQKDQPDEPRVLDPGVGARFNGADQCAAGFYQLHWVACEGAEYANSHHQRDQDLHGGHAEVAKPGVHAQAIALLAFWIE